MNEFDACWEVLAEEGKCDAKGSVEYERIRWLWERHGLMLAAMHFIVTRAILPPDQQPIEDRLALAIKNGALRNTTSPESQGQS